jgi:hypothetical protein
MNPSPRNTFVPDSAAYGHGSAEATLRLIAMLPAPEGLEDRVQAALNAAPRTARILFWPTMLRPQAGWMRAAAAAAIVFVVAGGGWGVYSSVRPGLQSGAKAVPLHVASPSAGFSSAGAMRTPQTLNGPLAPVAVTVAQPGKAIVKPPVKAAAASAHSGKTAAKGKAAVQPAANSLKQ